MQEMAIKLTTIYNVINFTRSNGVSKVKSRHNISGRFIKYESCLIDHERVESFKELYNSKLKEFCRKISSILMKLDFSINVHQIEVFVTKKKKKLAGILTRRELHYCFM